MAVARELGSASVVLSLLGGVTVEQLQAAYPAATVVRAMPNTASAIRQGVTCVCGAELAEVEALLERVGTVVRLQERLMDAATAVSGVAPAYVALIAEAWIDAAVAQGIPAAQAALLVGDSLAGSAALLQSRDMDTLGVRREVTSPGGMTARGPSRARAGRAAQRVRRRRGGRRPGPARRDPARSPTCAGRSPTSCSPSCGSTRS